MAICITMDDIDSVTTIFDRIICLAVNSQF